MTPSHLALKPTSLKGLALKIDLVQFYQSTCFLHTYPAEHFQVAVPSLVQSYQKSSKSMAPSRPLLLCCQARSPRFQLPRCPWQTPWGAPSKIHPKTWRKVAVPAAICRCLWSHPPEVALELAFGDFPSSWILIFSGSGNFGHFGL